MSNWNTLFNNAHQQNTDGCSVLDTLSSEKNYLVPLEDYRLITISGPDAIKFLQGQCTCDFTRLKDMDLLYGAHCNHKGRMNSSFVAAEFTHTEGEPLIGLRLHESIANKALEALKKYSVFSKVTLDIATDISIFGLLNSGKKHNPFESELALFNHSLAANDTTKKFRADDSACILFHDKGQIEIWSKNNHLNKMETSFFENAMCANQETWNHANIRRGIAEVHGELYESLIPQEINFQLIDGISFNKGCYTGQEIIARMHYRGQLKKHMYRAKTSSSLENIAIGTAALLTPQSDRPVGSVIQSARVSEGEHELLVLVNDDVVANNSGFLDLESSPKLTWLSLPYAIN